MMIGHLSSLILILLAVFGEQSIDRHNPSEWKELNVEQGHFAILLPDNSDSPEYLDTFFKITIHGKVTKLPAHEFGGSEGDVMYRVDYCDLAKGTTEDFLTFVRNNLKKDQSITYRDISLGSYSGIEFERRSPEGSFSGRIYQVNSRVYSLMVSRPRNTTAPDNTARFLNSLKLIPPR
jgi:hypothetical protein